MRGHSRPVLAANWKMNLTPAEASAFLDAFLSRYAPRDDRTVILFPSALVLAGVRERVRSRPDIRLGVQNVSTEEKGAFTGENSVAMAAGAGASYVLVGHSERRHVFGETDVQVAQKCARVVAHGLVPVLCVGETIEQRERGETGEVVLHQLRTGVSMLDHEAIRDIVVAYEPVWAIGTGRTATPQDASEVHLVIRAALAGIVGEDARAIPLLYGGSVNAANAASLLVAPEVEGLLVGGASLDPVQWAEICSR
ncbi:MAG TPA: triose-phosphate isomerase [Gemmatimonadaceae bacterium]|nr:triose-phosphate isomerase [Gemmatimonadaceae bacterium]